MEGRGEASPNVLWIRKAKHSQKPLADFYIALVATLNIMKPKKHNYLGFPAFIDKRTKEKWFENECCIHPSTVVTIYLRKRENKISFVIHSGWPF